MFQNLETVKQQIVDSNLNVERSMLVRWTLENGISCYRKLYEEKKKAAAVETMHDKYFSTK
jgi:nickel-dependent lactate racemase